MERNIGLFSGASNTFGLGLELEFRPKYNDHNWLLENGINIPLVREKEDKEYWKKYRWSKLVCDDLGLIEYNIHDDGNIMLGGNAIQTIWILLNENKQIKELLQKTKYIFLEIGYARWWDKNLHGTNDGKEYPNTFSEILDLINNPKSDRELVRKSLEWVEKYDGNLIWKESFEIYKKIKKLHPEIEFIILPWNADYRNFLDESSVDFINTKNYVCIAEYLKYNKLRIGDVAMAFNGNYKYNVKDEHPSSFGHRNIANMVINHINKNDNLEIFELKK
jgi:hypothetical protein